MSAYDNDPRVAVNPSHPGTFDITDSSVVGHVCPGLFGGWMAHSVGEDDVDGLVFDTADEAMRSLIGDPQ